MPFPDPAAWSDRLRHTLEGYHPSLLRSVAARLIRPRNQWPVADLIERFLTTPDNPAVIDRRLQEVPIASRQVLALLAHSRQPLWRVGNLVEIVLALGHPDGLQPILLLLQAGLLFPELPSSGLATRETGEPGRSATRVGALMNFDQWLTSGGTAGPRLFAHPQVAVRALGDSPTLPVLPPVTASADTAREADGLEWPLRLAALWQQAVAGPFRRTQGGSFFKRDLDRLSGDPLLSDPPVDSLVDLPDLCLLVVALAEAEGILREEEGHLHAGQLPPWWEKGLVPTLESLFAALFQLATWNPQSGFYSLLEGAGNPFPSTYLLTVWLLAQSPAEVWVRPADIETWLQNHHPFWGERGEGRGARGEGRGGRDEGRGARDEGRGMKNGEPGLKDEERGTSGSSPLAPHPSPLILNFLVGVLYPLRLIQAAHDQAGNWIVRLSPLGRWLLVRAEAPVSPPSYAQTLLVQPNLEILVFRQGLTPGLIGRITQLAAWKGLGPACTLQLQPATVYRALESGFTFESILQTLEQHSSRAVPPAVVDLLRTWAQKRDRIAVYPGAALLEFGAPEDLNEALARGLAAQRLTDRLALVAHGDDIDYKHFKLAGTRDYSLPPDRCVKLETDGVTLTIDQARSDLLLETEIPRFAEPVPPGGGTGLRQFRITPASLAAAQDNGLGAAALEIWFRQRTGESLSPAARLLLGKGEGRGTRDEEQGTREPPSLSPRSPPLAPQKAFLQQHLILKVASPEIADGLVQWPQTGMLIAERLGPTALVIAEDKVDDLRQQLALLGIQF